ncbi:MAG: hypothetical protein INR68_09915 [Methylobacterium mesophilicum]|nr:hypothetical protein [Methylobacterium mesophilicum]
MTKTLIAFGVLAALAAPAAAQTVSPRVSSQIVSDAYQGNTSGNATATRGLSNDGASVSNDLQRGKQGDTFGAQSR